MSNPYEITLNRAWTEWAIKCGVSEAVAAALFLISESRALHQILAKLTPAEFERVANIVEHSPDRFPLGTLTALKDWSAAPAPEAPATVSTDAPPNHRAGRSSFATERLRLNRSRGFGRFRAGVPQGVPKADPNRSRKDGHGRGDRSAPQQSRRSAAVLQRALPGLPRKGR
jgi:hypothetical protein